MEPTLQFILDHLEDDTARLLLSRQKWPSVDIDLAVSTIESRRKIRKKLPSWYAETGLLYPSTLSAEQCSGEDAARYKARLISRVVSSDDMRVADLTGGLGVDSWAFSSVASQVLYNERNEALCLAAKHNFGVLRAGNIMVRQGEVREGGVADILGSFRPDIIFLDPARRSATGGKVFRLEDCSPDVTRLLPELYAECKYVLLKLSPMADISLLARELPGVKEVHVIESGGECKELLLLLERGFEGEYTVIVGGLSFSPSEEASSTVTFAEINPSVCAGSLLFEPGPALAKAGAFKLISARYGLRKLAPSTHLYVCETVPPELSCLGKFFTVRYVLPFSKAGLRVCAGLIPEGRAEVSAHNLPIRSDELRRRLGCLSGGTTHIFAASTLHDRVLIIAER